MQDSAPTVARLLDAVAPYVTRRPGTYLTPTPLPRLAVWSSTQTTEPAPAVFKPMFSIVLQGTEVLLIGGSRFALSGGDCIATSFGLPFVGHFENASLAAPYVAISLDLDVDLLIKVMSDMPRAEDRWVCSAAGGAISGTIGDAALRLVGLLGAPEDQPVLARAYEAELYYRLLQGPMGDTLRQLGQRDGRLRRIKEAADWLVVHADKPVVITDLAASIGMSLTSFHRHFKAVTGYSPLAFQRQMRLLDARRRLAAGGVTVSNVAYAVGYTSPSQFSREYKSLFGTPPAADLLGRT